MNDVLGEGSPDKNTGERRGQAQSGVAGSALQAAAALLKGSSILRMLADHMSESLERRPGPLRLERKLARDS